MKNITLTIIAAILPFIKLFAQQDPQYTRYMFSNAIINPAHIAKQQAKKLSVSTIYRNQWLGMDGSPKSYLLNAYGSISKKVNLGGIIENDVIGIHNRLSCQLMYGYQVPFKNKMSLSFGLSGGIILQTTDWSKINDVADIDDPILTNGNISTINPDFKLGALFDFSDGYYIGISASHLSAIFDKDFPFDVNYYFIAGGNLYGYQIGLPDEIELRYSTMLKIVPIKSPLEVDINVNFVFNDRFCIGTGFHSGAGIPLVFQYWTPKRFKFGYSFDYNLNRLAGTNLGSHEVMLSYEIIKKKERAKPPKRPQKNSKKKHKH